VAPIGLGFSALIFFGSFLYQDKKEHLNGALQCFSVAMQWFTLVLWPMHGVHCYLCWYPVYYKWFSPYGAGNVDGCSLVVVRKKILTLAPFLIEEGI